jgi:hypothetical protein
MFYRRVVHIERRRHREGVGFSNKCEMRRSSAAENKHYALFINAEKVKRAATTAAKGSQV